MYEYLQPTLDLADSIGEVENITMNRWRKDTIEVSGHTPEGLEFEIELTVKPTKEATNE